jgi:hypothetical protein
MTHPTPADDTPTDTTTADDTATTSPAGAAGEGTAESVEAVRREAWTGVVGLLTTAAGTPHPRYGDLDVADFLASALAAVAANVGGVECLLGGRSGSWEADLVRQLVAGTVGWDAEHLHTHRTVAVRVPLNVAGVLSDHLRHRPTLLDALDDIDRAYVARLDALTVDGVVPEAHLEAFEALLGRQRLEEAAATDRYRQAFTAYAQAFAEAVHAAAADLLPGLSVPVYVDVDAEPDAIWWPTPTTTSATSSSGTSSGTGTARVITNPDLAERYDPVVSRLWVHAFEHTPTTALDALTDSQAAADTDPATPHGHRTGASGASGVSGGSR